VLAPERGGGALRTSTKDLAAGLGLDGAAFQEASSSSKNKDSSLRQLGPPSPHR